MPLNIEKGNSGRYNTLAVRAFMLLHDSKLLSDSPADLLVVVLVGLLGDELGELLVGLLDEVLVVLLVGLVSRLLT